MNKQFATIEREFLELQAEGLSFEELVELLKRRLEARSLPVSIFADRRISALEAITKYLREEKNLSLKEISGMLARNYDPIGRTYRNARKKLAGRLDISSRLNIPTEIFRNRRLSVLENLTRYLKEKERLSFRQIALLLKRDDRTIWTAYTRSLKKNGA